MIRALLWKEWRETRTVLVLFAMILAVIALAASTIMFFGDERATRAYKREIIQFGYTAIWPICAMVMAAAGFAHEREVGTNRYLSSLPVSSLEVWLVKILYGAWWVFVFGVALEIIRGAFSITSSNLYSVPSPFAIAFLIYTLAVLMSNLVAGSFKAVVATTVGGVVTALLIFNYYFLYHRMTFDALLGGTAGFVFSAVLLLWGSRFGKNKRTLSARLFRCFGILGLVVSSGYFLIQYWFFSHHLVRPYDYSNFEVEHELERHILEYGGFYCVATAFALVSLPTFVRSRRYKGRAHMPLWRDGLVLAMAILLVIPMLFHVHFFQTYFHSYIAQVYAVWEENPFHPTRHIILEVDQRERIFHHFQVDSETLVHSEFRETSLFASHADLVSSHSVVVHRIRHTWGVPQPVVETWWIDLTKGTEKLLFTREAPHTIQPHMRVQVFPCGDSHWALVSYKIHDFMKPGKVDRVRIYDRQGNLDQEFSFPENVDVFRLGRGIGGKILVWDWHRKKLLVQESENGRQTVIHPGTEWKRDLTGEREELVSLSDIHFSPGGTYFTVTGKVKDRRGQVVYRLWRREIADGKTRGLCWSPHTISVIPNSWAGRGEGFLFFISQPHGGKIKNRKDTLCRVDGRGKWEKVYSVEGMDTYIRGRYPQGNRIVVELAQNNPVEEYKSKVVILNREKGKWKVESEKTSVSMYRGVWSPSRRYYLAHLMQVGRSELFRFDLKTGKSYPIPLVKRGLGDGLFNLVAVTERGKTYLIRSLEVFSHTPGQKKLKLEMTIR